MEDSTIAPRVSNELSYPLLSNGSTDSCNNVNGKLSSCHSVNSCVSKDLKNHADTNAVDSKHYNPCGNDVRKPCSSGHKELIRAKSCYDNAPDGGWGWMVTFSAFMVGVILDGISFSFGLFFVELLAHFGESKSLTSWIISVMNGTYLGIGKEGFFLY